MGDITTLEFIKLVLPFIVLELGLKLFCFYLILKKGVRNLSKVIWSLILLVQVVGPISFLLFGRRREFND
ncbi:PLDc N-terminal domain-containing protein [Alkaliphilus hydrothermalis]|uniref:Cardiolipin synthase N-terminal domain-containing protein n=1 Tax=Alkaliphilus hydrothermalis TaxID=1482730 RepID=A0ABS2NMV1_9FIRM|nr:PLDc N-terminal domain-containing protein [Alkaliphilus hydrothermalis]MBM7614288.1 hypothetical protein [Alkaliphilus hydrothermalis]